jgi:hypothetical protein
MQATRPHGLNIYSFIIQDLWRHLPLEFARAASLENLSTEVGTSIARIKKAPANCRGLTVLVGTITGSSDFLEEIMSILHFSKY